MKFSTKKISVLLAFLYACLGFSILSFDDGMINEFLKSDSITSKVDGIIDVFIIFPSHIFGSLIWFVLSGATEDSKYLIVIGQVIGFFIYTPLFYLIIKTTIKINQNVKRSYDSVLGIPVFSSNKQSLNERRGHQDSISTKAIYKMDFYISPMFWLGLLFVIIGLKLGIMKITHLINPFIAFYDMILGLIWLLIDFYIRGIPRSFSYKIVIQIVLVIIMLTI